MHASRRKGLPGPKSIMLGASDRGGPASGPYWAELRTFVAVAQLRSINKAADALSVSRRTVRRDMERLEDQVGHQLTVSSAAGTEMTAIGRKIYDQAIGLDRGLSAIQREARSTPHRLEGTVRLAVTDGMGLIYLAPALPEFSQAHPGIRLHLRRPSGIRQIREDAADLQIGFGAESEAGLESRLLGTLRFVPYVGEAYLEARRALGWRASPTASSTASATSRRPSSSRPGASSSPPAPWRICATPP